MFRQLESHREDGMSLHDKMSIWGRKSGNDEHKVDNSDRFVGVEDFEEEEEEEDENNAELSAYSKAIMNSTAYEWLIARLLKESSFHWDESQPRIMIQDIRQKILNKLPTGAISKNRAPSTYNVAFHLPWGPSKLGSENKKCPILPGQILSECIVLTCSTADHVQVTTARQYLDQTWPFGGTELLCVLQEALEGTSTNPQAFILPDKTEIGAVVEDSGIVIWVVGSAYSIAECGEQLAWLVAALQASDPDTIIHSTPVMTAYKPDKDKSAHQPYQYHWSLGNSHKCINMTSTLFPLLRMSWHNTLFMSSFVIVRGFPTAQRPDHCPGVEVPPEILFDLVQPLNLTITDERVLLQGRHATLQLVEKTTGLLFWHVLLPAQVCFCQPRVLYGHAVHSINANELMLAEDRTRLQKVHELYDLRLPQYISLPQVSLHDLLQVELSSADVHQALCRWRPIRGQGICP